MTNGNIVKNSDCNDDYKKLPRGKGGGIINILKHLIIPGAAAGIVIGINCIIKAFNPAYAESLLSVGEYGAFYGICANVSVTFIALLFAIAAINISLKNSKGGSNIGRSATDGAYGLKLLIKEDLIRVSCCTIILQLVLLLINQIYSIPNFIHFPLMAVTITLMIYALWFTVNSVYYSIVQNNVNPILQDNLLDITGPDYEIWDYPHARYDVYTVKKTLYPSLYKLLLHQKDNDIQRSRKIDSKNESEYHKSDLIRAWNDSFYEVLKDARHNVFTLSIQNKKSYLQTLKKDAFEDKEYCKKYLKLFKPKIQAPDWVVEICLDYEEQYANDKELLESLLCLLHCSKSYIEDRQDERRLRHLWINRSKYKNLNDTFMYTLYGNLLYNLSSYENDYEVKTLYYREAKEMYDLAVTINFENIVAQHNCGIINGLLEAAKN